MKIVVDFDLCQSHGLCTEAAPELFEIRDDGFLWWQVAEYSFDGFSIRSRSKA